MFEWLHDKAAERVVDKFIDRSIDAGRHLSSKDIQEAVQGRMGSVLGFFGRHGYVSDNGE